MCAPSVPKGKKANGDRACGTSEASRSELAAADDGGGRGQKVRSEGLVVVDEREGAERGCVGREMKECDVTRCLCKIS